MKTMAQTDAEPQLTYRQFLDFVAGKEGRYEYVDGRAVAMGTSSNEHQDISLIVASALRQHLRGERCKVRTAAALWAIARERSPDVLVTCHESDLVSCVSNPSAKCSTSTHSPTKSESSELNRA